MYIEVRIRFVPVSEGCAGRGHPTGRLAMRASSPILLGRRVLHDDEQVVCVRRDCITPTHPHRRFVSNNDHTVIGTLEGGASQAIVHRLIVGGRWRAPLILV